MTPELQRRSVPEELRDCLRDQIRDGLLAPGEHLREEDLASRFGVSRGTVREALRTLENGGLVQRDVHRGCRVTLLVESDIRDIIAARQIIETEVVRRAAEQRLLMEELQPIAIEMQAAGNRGDWARYGELDLTFHTGLVAGAGSARLAAFFRSQIVVLMLAWLRIDAMEAAPGIPAPHVEEHAELLSRIRDGDVGGAVSLIQHHIEGAARRLLS